MKKVPLLLILGGCVLSVLTVVGYLGGVDIFMFSLAHQHTNSRFITSPVQASTSQGNSPSLEQTEGVLAFGYETHLALLTQEGLLVYSTTPATTYHLLVPHLPYEKDHALWNVVINDIAFLQPTRTTQDDEDRSGYTYSKEPLSSAAFHKIKTRGAVVTVLHEHERFEANTVILNEL